MLQVPPNDKDLEEAIIGAILLDNKAYEIATDIINSDCFYHQKLSIIFSSCQTLYNNLEPIDLITVTKQLQKEGNLKMIGGAYELSKITDRISNTVNLKTYCYKLFELWLKRRQIEIAQNILNEAYDKSKDVFDSIEKIENEVYNLSNFAITKDFEHISKGIKEGLERIELLRHNKISDIGVPSGFAGLDKHTGGWQNGNLIILAARPSVGKSSLSLNFAVNAAISGYCTAFFSLEMSTSELVQRALSERSEIPLKWIKEGNISDGKMMQLMNNDISRLSESQLFIDDTAGIKIGEIRSKARRLKNRHDLKLVIIDYLQLVETSRTKGNRETEVAFISRQLKKLAKELNVPIIALSQLSREIEKREGSPRLSDLRESGAIEQDADIVSFLYRQDDFINMSFAKHRNGSLFTLEFDPDLSIQKWKEKEDQIEYEEEEIF